MHRVAVWGAASLIGFSMVLLAPVSACAADTGAALALRADAGPDEDVANDGSSAASAAWNAPTDWAVKTSVGWNSEYIIRGFQIAKQEAVASFELDWKNWYAGAVGHFPVADAFDSYPTKVVAFGGNSFDVNDDVWVDVGFNAYLYPDDGQVVGSQNSFEPYVGFGLSHALFHPSLYAYYDAVRERYTLEATGSYSLPLGRTDFVLGGKAGVAGGQGLDYAYAQGDAELVQNINAKVSVGMGAHFAASTENTFLDGLTFGADTTTWFGFRLKARS